MAGPGTAWAWATSPRVPPAAILALLAALGAAGAPGTPEVDARRRAVNLFIRTSGIFDGVADFDRATHDAATGALRAEFQPGSTVGRTGDRLHPNRGGYQAMVRCRGSDSGRAAGRACRSPGAVR